jgi:DegV family protein with EDD domain
VTLNPENTAIVLDSTADFPDAQIRFPNMRVVPLYVRFGETSFRDYVELDPRGFYERLRTSDALPTTSQPTPLDFFSVYEALASYDRIYSLHLSSKLSGTFQSALLASEEVGGDRIKLVDTESASIGIAMLALDLQRLLERGTDEAEIDALITRHREDAVILFTVDTLEYLAKGGRIGRAQAFAGSLLKVKPILTIEDGEVVPLTRVRGRQKALEEFRRRFEEATTDGPGLRVGIAHAQAGETVEQLRALVLEARPQAEIELVTSLGAVVGTHAGPGTIGFFWLQSPPS